MNEDLSVADMKACPVARTVLAAALLASLALPA